MSGGVGGSRCAIAVTRPDRRRGQKLELWLTTPGAKAGALAYDAGAKAGAFAYDAGAKAGAFA
jgi:hypothetical protein